MAGYILPSGQFVVLLFCNKAVKIANSHLFIRISICPFFLCHVASGAEGNAWPPYLNNITPLILPRCSSA
ncbi:hypothetical protein FQ626_06510 [Erwinia pyrifoliae]|nr:hypothetical protein [Erwinia pyrifoliae]